MAKFIIMALPRSRTKWLSEFLSFEGKHVIGHDLAVDCSSLQDFEDALDAVDGSVETGAMLGWRLLLKRHPDWRVVTIHRPLWQIANSFARLGVNGIDWENMKAREAMLEALTLQPGVRGYGFDELDVEHTIASIWEFCLRRDFDYEWWVEMRSKNIQINMAERVARLQANGPALDLLKSEILAETAKLGERSCGLN